MRKTFLCTVFACALVASMAQPAAATIIANTYAFTASRFTQYPSGDVPAPYDPVSGSFTLTFDTEVNYIGKDQTVGLVFNAINMPVDGQPGQPLYRWDYFKNSDAIEVGSYDLPIIGSFGGADHFFLDISHISSAPVLVNFLYSSKTGNAFFEAHEFALTVTPAPGREGGVPEPQSWALAIVGLGMVGGVLRRHRRPSLA